MTAWAPSRSLPSIIAAESRYFWACLVSGSHSQVTSGFLGSSSTLTALPSCGQVKLLKASIASWLGASIHFSGSPTSGPPGGLGMTGLVEGVPPSVGAVALSEGWAVAESVGEVAVPDGDWVALGCLALASP